MRVIALADTHLPDADIPIPEGDVLVHAGDLCRYGTLEELRRAASWLHSLPHPIKIVVAGNHDRSLQLAPEQSQEILGPQIIYLLDSEIEIGGLRWWGSPWTPVFFDWAFMLPRGAPMQERWALIPPGIDILITHGPPRLVGDRTHDGRHEGCSDLRDRIRKIGPRLHVFGHIHEDGGHWREEGTLFTNVTTCEGKRAPTVIEIRAQEVEIIAS